MAAIKSPSVYAIVNNKNGKKYIGGASYPSQRWYEHKSALKLNRHRNPELQKDWNNQNASDFLFQIIEVVDSEYLSSREDYHIKNTKNLYNLLPGFCGRKKEGCFPSSTAKYERAEREHTREMLLLEGFKSANDVITAIKRLDIGKRNLIFAMLRENWGMLDEQDFQSLQGSG